MGQIRKHIDRSFFQTMTPQLSYFLGMLASDGNITDTGFVSLAQSGPKGLHHMEQIAALIGYDGKIYRSKTTHNDSHSIHFKDKVALDCLSSYGIGPRKTLTLEYPSGVLDGFFLRGYFDGDGSLGYYNNGKGVYSFCVNFVATPAFMAVAQQKIPVPGKVRTIRTAKNLAEYRAYSVPAFMVYDWLFRQHKLDILSPKQVKYESIQWQPQHSELSKGIFYPAT